MIQVDSKASKRMNDTAATSAFEGSFAAAVFGGSSTAATPFGALTASSASSPAATMTSLFSTAFTTDASSSSSSTTPFSAFAKPSAPATSVATTTSSSSSGFSLGTSFHGPLMAAKKATEDIGSSFIVIESFLGNCFSGSNDSNSGEVDSGSRFQGLGLYGYMDPLLLGDKKSGSISKVEIQPTTIYPLLEDLHSIFSDLPSMGKALAHVQKMLLDVNRGEVLDAYAVFDNIIHKDVVSWNAMIAGLVENGLTEDAFSLFSLMVKGPTQPNSAFMNDWKP
ncbi:Tetratricopeptide-like helical domain superfamily [Sesbania bispinosa]|nr:Tetratricopeptide-like helical domain superfamily [Sesbania bispinosa]